MQRGKKLETKRQECSQEFCYWEPIHIPPLIVKKSRNKCLLQRPEKSFYLLAHCHLIIITDTQVNNQVKYCSVGSQVCWSAIGSRDPSHRTIQGALQITWLSLTTNKKNKRRLLAWLQRVYSEYKNKWNTKKYLIITKTEEWERTSTNSQKSDRHYLWVI